MRREGEGAGMMCGIHAIRWNIDRSTVDCEDFESNQNRFTHPGMICDHSTTSLLRIRSTHSDYQPSSCWTVVFPYELSFEEVIRHVPPLTFP